MSPWQDRSSEGPHEGPRDLAGIMSRASGLGAPPWRAPSGCVPQGGRMLGLSLPLAARPGPHP